MSDAQPRTTNYEPRTTSSHIIFENVSKFYGDVLGVNRVNLSIPPGITSLVGPNGSGKTTLMNLMTGLIRPTRGHIRVLGIRTDQPDELFRYVGYCTQFDSFPKGFTGYQFVYSYLRLYGCAHGEADELAWKAIERVGLMDAARRKIAAYSKATRQRIKLAHSTRHAPSVLVLDGPLNGLDPLVRSVTSALFRSLSADAMHVVFSRHILHAVVAISDHVILLTTAHLF